MAKNKKGNQKIVKRNGGSITNTQANAKQSPAKPATPSKPAAKSSAKQAAKSSVKQASKPAAPKPKLIDDEFVMTISDSEEVAVADESTDDEKDAEENEEPAVAPKKKVKKNKKQEKSNGPQQNSEFNLDFEFDDGTQKLLVEDEGWNFDVPNKKKHAREVDLDEIIRKKGGLDNAQTSDEEQDDSDDDDLAMDGFGMGSKEDEDGEDEDEEKEEEEEESGSEEEDKEEFNANAKYSRYAQPQDSAEALSKFYESSKIYTTTSAAEAAAGKSFQDLQLSRPVLRGIASLNFTSPTPIQNSVIPLALLGKDIVAGAVTGSGKTGAYLIPILERLAHLPKKIALTRVLILTPTRELAIQVSDVATKLSKFMPNIAIGQAIGGLNLKQQEKALKSRPDIVIATPGRFIDHVRNSPSFQVDGVEILVIDEADRMLEQGFHEELNEILNMLPQNSKRQTLLFSATMNSSINDLIQLSLNKPSRIQISPAESVAENLVQEFIKVRNKMIAYKPSILYWLLKKVLDCNHVKQKIIIFVNRKDDAHKLRIIMGLFGIHIGELHGGLTQEQRVASVTRFSNMEVPILICTDLAARGLDIPNIRVVINYDLPAVYETYQHRVGRTARAGRDGRSISLVLETASDRSIARDAIRKSTQAKVTGKFVTRSIDWEYVNEMQKGFEEKEEVLKEVLEEERTEKLLAQAEREITKSENLIKHEAEIKSRPKRTWFESQADSISKHRSGPLTDQERQAKRAEDARKKVIDHPSLGAQLPKAKKAKVDDDDASSKVYKKTKTDRDTDHKLTMLRKNSKKTVSKKNDKKVQAKIARAKKYKK